MILKIIANSILIIQKSIIYMISAKFIISWLFIVCAVIIIIIGYISIIYAFIKYIKNKIS